MFSAGTGLDIHSKSSAVYADHGGVQCSDPDWPFCLLSPAGYFYPFLFYFKLFDLRGSFMNRSGQAAVSGGSLSPSG